MIRSVRPVPLAQNLLAVSLWLAILACAPVPPMSSGEGTAIPFFHVDSITGGPGAEKLSALVGTVSDSASGAPLARAQVLLTSQPPLGSYYTFANKNGGFVLGNIVPGQYQVLVRYEGYGAYRETRDMGFGMVDTLRVRMPRRGWCGGIDCQ